MVEIKTVEEGGGGFLDYIRSTLILAKFTSSVNRNRVGLMMCDVSMELYR